MFGTVGYLIQRQQENHSSRGHLRWFSAAPVAPNIRRDGDCCNRRTLSTDGSGQAASAYDRPLPLIRTGVWHQAEPTVTVRVSHSSGGTVHGVVSPGAQVTSNCATAVAVPAPTALNTAVAVLPDGLYETKFRIEVSEMVGDESCQCP
jgi:hypothetical protein